MATVLLVRHGRSTANTGGVLAGHTPGVLLDEVGQQQADALVGRLAGLELAAAISSPLERCMETAQRALAGREADIRVDERIVECRYGDWTGKELKSLTDDPMWKVVQRHPSAVEAIREFNAEFGDRAVYAVFSHGDVIKAILADALGLHLDQFQRIVVNPCSVSVVTYTPERPFVHRMNDTSGDFASFAPPVESDEAASDAVVGGGTGDGR